MRQFLTLAAILAVVLVAGATPAAAQNQPSPQDQLMIDAIAQMGNRLDAADKKNANLEKALADVVGGEFGTCFTVR